MTTDRDEPVRGVTADDVRIVTLKGRLSALHSATVAGMITEAVSYDRAEPRALVVDMSGVEIIDASIARTLRRALVGCERVGVRASLAGVDGQPMELLEIIGLAKDLGAYRTLDEAITTVADPLCEAGVGGDTIELQVHRLVAEAHRLPDGDPRRQALQARAAEAALPLARTMALRYRQRGEPFDDLLQVAALGVVRAVHGYDPDRVSGFLAYAVPTILGELRKHFRDHSWTVRPPRRLQELRPLIAQTSDALTQTLGCEPTLADVAEKLTVDVADVESAVLSEAGLRPLSLDASTSTIGDRRLYDTLGTDDPDMARAEVRLSLAPLIAELPPTHRKILSMRFVADMTQQEIATELGTSQMNVSRILAALMAKFRKALTAEP